MPLISHPTSQDATQSISWSVQHWETKSVESVANDLIQRPLRGILRITLLKRRPCVQAFDSRIVRQQRVDQNHLRGHRCAMSALSPTLSPSATSVSYPSHRWRAGAYSSVRTHFSTGRNLSGAKLIPVWVQRILAKEGEDVLCHRLRSQGAVALRLRGARHFLFHLSHFDAYFSAFPTAW